MGVTPGGKIGNCTCGIHHRCQNPPKKSRLLCGKNGSFRFLTRLTRYRGRIRSSEAVNLLALRLQWFESTPTQASPRAILQVMAQLAPAGINIIIDPQNQTHLPAAMFHRSLLLWICPASAASYLRGQAERFAWFLLEHDWDNQDGHDVCHFDHRIDGRPR